MLGFLLVRALGRDTFGPWDRVCRGATSCTSIPGRVGSVLTSCWTQLASPPVSTRCGSPPLPPTIWSYRERRSATASSTRCSSASTACTRGEPARLSRRLDAGEHLAPVVRELAVRQRLAAAALGQQGHLAAAARLATGQIAPKIETAYSSPWGATSVNDAARDAVGLYPIDDDRPDPLAKSPKRKRCLRSIGDGRAPGTVKRPPVRP